MSRCFLVLVLILASAFSGHAQEREVDHFIVELGIIPWERIQKGYHRETSFDTYQYRMAKEMAKMHKGGRTGDHHLLVVIRDRTSGGKSRMQRLRLSPLPGQTPGRKRRNLKK